LDSSYTLNEELDLPVQGCPGLFFQLVQLIENPTKWKQFSFSQCLFSNYFCCYICQRWTSFGVVTHLPCFL